MLRGEIQVSRAEYEDAEGVGINPRIKRRMLMDAQLLPCSERQSLSRCFEAPAHLFSTHDVQARISGALRSED